MKYNLIIAAVCSVVFSLQSCSNNNNEEAKAEATQDTATAHTTDHSNASSHNSNNELMTAMKGSMEKMMSMKMSGDFDHDFAAMMIEHHQGAVDMAQVEVAKGTDTAIKSMARKIIDAQKSEIVMLRSFIDKNKPGATKADGHNHLGDAMQEMENKMKASTMTGNIDRDFVIMMIPHHESAIKMAEDEISHGKSLELKKMAQKMMDDQSREIKEMQAWLNTNK